ncbi:hypothetical protein BP422_12070 [Brevibacillus formosus]|uniref:Uncharacterized protein n=1 Tax=Brevibacillus formosus TaxID=54913 RepID=A0A220MGR5_9BACL|nr:hypothetical protein [Brevibacillus formosus]ASJ54218.1 hypothetical protein BP422_12070 [Brevibacillus formosus]
MDRKSDLTKLDRVDYAATMLAWYLAEGPKPYDKVKEHCAGLGITRFELKEARKDLNVRTINTGSTWLWQVPEPVGENHA